MSFPRRMAERWASDAGGFALDVFSNILKSSDGRLPDARDVLASGRNDKSVCTQCRKAHWDDQQPTERVKLTLSLPKIFKCQRNKTKKSTKGKNHGKSLRETIP